MKHFLPSCLAVILLSVASAAQTITSFDVPGGTNTQPIAISPAGAVTGSYAVPNTTRVRGFVRDLAGKIVTFDVAGANTYPASINLWGQITGIYTTNTYGVPPFHGFVRQPNGAIITFDAPNAWDTEATSINDSGEILGWMQSNYSATNWNVFQAFVRKADGTFKTFDITDAYSILALSVNEKGQSIGYWTNTVATRTHGFLRQAWTSPIRSSPTPLHTLSTPGDKSLEPIRSSARFPPAPAPQIRMGSCARPTANM